MPESTGGAEALSYGDWRLQAMVQDGRHGESSPLTMLKPCGRVKTRAMIQTLAVQERQKPAPIVVAGPGDFRCTPAEPVEVDILWRNPRVSLYCLDHDNRQAMFVETPEGVDIMAQPFLYQAQYEHARRLLVVPYDLLHRVAASLPPSGTALVLIHSPGRSGTTLMSKVFQEIEAVVSLSEPDVYTQIVALRLTGGRDPDLIDLLRSATAMLFNPALAGGSTLRVVKFRSFCIQIADLLAEAAPSAVNLFMYRELGALIASYARLLTVVPAGRGAQEGIARYVPLLAERLRASEDPVSRVELITLMCLSVFHRYVELHQQGLAMLPVRYEDLLAEPEATLHRVFDQVGLEAHLVEVGARALARDSQAGSMLARDALGQDGGAELGDREWEEVRTVLQQHPLDLAGVPGLASLTTSVPA